MRICDRCMAKSTEQITFESDDQRIDLCESCRQDVLELISSRPQKKLEVAGKGKRAV